MGSIIELIIDIVLEIIDAMVSEYKCRWLKISFITILVLAILGIVVYSIVA